MQKNAENFSVCECDYQLIVEKMCRKRDGKTNLKFYAELI